MHKRSRDRSSILLHDSEIKNSGLMVALSPCMTTTLSMVHTNLKKLNQLLMVKSTIRSETNLSALVDLFLELSLDYENLAVADCTYSN